MKKLWIASPLAMLLGAAALLSGCGGSSTTADSGSSGGSSSSGSSSSGSGSSGSSSGATGTAALVYGCNWLFESDAQTANIEYPDTNAVYWIAALPDTIPSGDQIQIAGTSATARYFSFSIYNENGKAEASADDAELFGAGSTPANAVSPGQAYTVSVIYSLTASSSGTTLVANPLDISTRAPAHKFLVYRLYLPTSGAADFGNLPALTYVAASGTRTPLSATPDQASCNTILSNIENAESGGSSSSSSSGGLEPTPAVKPPKMAIYRSTSGRFQNLDVKYMYEKINDTLGDMLIIRGQAPSVANGAQSPQVRYWSICSDGAHAPYPVVACLADQDAMIGSDGYYNVIISTNTPPSGYQSAFNYLPFGAAAFGRPIYRQLLASSSFSLSIAANDLSLDPASSMGAYYPGSTYCSNSVFSANVGAGAAAAFSACQSSEGIGTVPDTGD